MPSFRDSRLIPGYDPLSELAMSDALNDDDNTYVATEQLTKCDMGPKITPQGIIVTKYLIDCDIPEPVYDQSTLWAERTTNPADYVAKRGDLIMGYVEPDRAFTTRAVLGAADGIIGFASMNGREIGRPIRFLGVSDWAQDGMNINQDNVGTLRIFGPVTIINRGFYSIAAGQNVYASPSPAYCFVDGRKVAALLSTGQPDNKHMPSVMTFSCRDLELLHEDLRDKLDEHLLTYSGDVEAFLDGLDLFIRGERISESSPLDPYARLYGHYAAYEAAPQNPTVHKALVLQCSAIYEEKAIHSDRYSESIYSPGFLQEPFESPYDAELQTESDPHVKAAHDGTIGPLLHAKMVKMRRETNNLLSHLKANMQIHMNLFLIGKAMSAAEPGRPLDVLLGIQS
jgi:hypothetical protein